MRWFRTSFEFYINSHIHVAIAICSLVCITYLTFDIEINPELLAFVFFASISGYNFIKYFGLARFHHKRLAPWLRQIQIFAMLCFGGLIFFLFRLPVNTIGLFLITAAITFFYAIPILPKRFLFDAKKNLRGISGLKIYVVALVWMAVSVAIPVLDSGETITHDMRVHMIQLFLYVLVATLPFEIRDLQFDSLKLATIPQKIGLGATKLLGAIVLVVVVMMEFLRDDFRIKNTLILSVMMVITLIFLLFSNKNQKQYYSSFWVEAIPIFWGVLLWAVS